MSRVFLMFSAALVALMAGALFYAARFPAESLQPPESTSTAESVVATAQSMPAASSTEAAAPRLQFSLPDIDGTARNLSDWDGKRRILNFWATWCAPCRREIPVLKAFQEQQADNGFQVIGIAVDFSEEVSHYAQAAQFNYPVLVGQEAAMEIAETSGIEFMALPFTMFVSAEGDYVGAYMGELHAEQLAEVVNIMTQLDGNEIGADEARDALFRL